MIILIIEIVLLALALFLSYTFSGAETAIVSLHYKGGIDEYLKYPKTKRIIVIWKKQSWRILNSIVIWNNICVIVISLICVNIAKSVSGVTNFSTNFLVFWFSIIGIILVFLIGDVFPKIIARENSKEFFLKVAPIVLFFEKIIYPINKILRRHILKFSDVFGLEIEEQPKIDEEDVLEVLDISEGIDEGEKEVIESLISFENMMVKSIMMPRGKMDAVEASEPFDSILEKLKVWKHSRIPVYDKDLDNVLGLLYAKDLLVLNENMDLIILNDMIRPAYFIPPTKKIGELLKEFKEGHYHVAIVVDEYDVVQGMVTIEDIIEEIVGDILDEYDVYDTDIVKLIQNRYSVNADIDLIDLDDAIDSAFEEKAPEDVRTLSAYIMYVAGHIPLKGEIICDDEFNFWIKEIDGRVIKRVIVTPIGIKQ